MENLNKVINVARKITEQNANARTALTALSNITHSHVIGVSVTEGKRTTEYGITEEKLEKLRLAVRLLNEVLIGDYDIDKVVNELVK